MNRKHLSSALLVLLTTLLVACGGGGGGSGDDGAKTSGSQTSTELPFPLSVVIAKARFLLFPNPQREGFNGADQTNTQAYADAYYAAIDPNSNRTTLAAWKSVNGFGNGTGDERKVVFGDKNDLGYGRRMTARQSPDGSLAFMVDNYLVETGSQGYTYSSVNIDAAVVQSSQRFVSVSAIEYSDLDGPGGVNGPKFVKFYNFAADGSRNTMVDQDGLGDKAMPHICVNCHGGRADRLTTTGLFPLVANAASQQAGDVSARLQVLKVHTFDFSKLKDPTTNSVRTRASQEADMKVINQWISATYSNTGINEWDGSVAQNFIQTAYGGAGFPNASYSDVAATAFVPDSNWTSSGQAGLYQNVVAPSCMTCHILRGTKNQDDISFKTFTQFSNYADRIKAHVFDRGNMPLAKIVFEQFWATGGTLPQQLAAVPSIAAQGATATLQPGRPIADPGPDRFVRIGQLNLSAVNSLFASDFSWSLVTNPGNAASFVGATNSSNAVLNLTANGTYVVRLTATGNGLTDTKDITVLVDNTNAPNPATLNFAAIQAQFTTSTCNSAGCHSGNNAALSGNANKPPLSYNSADYASVNEFYNTVRSRINFTDVVASPLLRKPSGKHHGGGVLAQPQFDTSMPLGTSPARSGYDLFVEWIMAGAPQ